MAALQPLLFPPIIRANHTASLVVHAKDEPVAAGQQKLALVLQVGEYLSISEVEGGSSPVSLNSGIFIHRR